MKNVFISLCAVHIFKYFTFQITYLPIRKKLFSYIMLPTVNDGMSMCKFNTYPIVL